MTPLEKIEKKIEQIEKLLEKIKEIIEKEENNVTYDFDKWEGTD